ncbi:MAG TPA: hypothetical protein PLK46_07410 [Propioniciclava sp.]|uniref:hypothetical protein n=1 Tax=Propioniciclava sp. TaxID=2038686 RepID=UPI002BEFA40C|nr:hypothetical protein [Propioniciclava sp.]HRL50214.1 hypothetical protein [Propioniciclava sp.]HRL80142.1 hypothetical protein [Propioniciclava sp.]
MSDAFAWRWSGGGRGLRVTSGGEDVCEVTFGIPEGPEAGVSHEVEDEVSYAVGEIGFRLSVRDLVGDWAVELALDNRSDETQAAPPLGMVVRVAPGWTGWSWTAESDGFLVISREEGDRPSLLIRLRQGFLRESSPSPRFSPSGRRAEALEPNMAAFFLANPTGSLRPFARHVTRLEFGPIDRLEQARAAMPGWVPELIARPGDAIRFDTPDQALVPGHGVTVASDDIAGVATAAAGHREIAVHGARGVTRLRPTFEPDPRVLAAEVVAPLLGRRPGGLPTASGAVVAAALSRRVVADPNAALDWLEQEDWLAREDQFAPLVALAVAVETHDEALGIAALDVLARRRFGAGDGLIASWAWVAGLQMGVAPLDLSAILAKATTPAERFEASLVGQGPEAVCAGGVQTLVRRLGADLPGAPMGLGATDAGLAIALLRAVPEHSSLRAEAVAASDKAAALLAADYVDGLQPTYDGLAWLLWSETLS